MKTFEMKGKVPIDEYFPLDKKHYHVLEHKGKVYSATLNQTSINANSNKFYIIQILQNDSNPNCCYLFTRWGRVGVKGQHANAGNMSIEAAIANYSTKYREKHIQGEYR